MRRKLPLFLTFITGLIFLISFFIPHPISRTTFNEGLNWMTIIGIFALVIGIHSFVYHHSLRIKRKVSGWYYSVISLITFTAMAAFGIAGGLNNNVFRWLYDYGVTPLGATMFATLAFYIASAAYRAFRARTLEATLLLLAAFIVMLGMIPLGNAIWGGIPKFAQWLLDVPNMAGKRGIWLGIGIGSLGTSIKMWLGIERGYLGGGK